ncbi:MAG TPA: TonB-dependent receptor [Thermoanaerobaculaceae bacterium]|nr:TonB-dependent receptor [Thermoanaerobaculaceae bacterium]
MLRSRDLFVVLVLLVVGVVPALGQGNPTGTITGHVTDPDNLALPGVTVTVASPRLQGVRTVSTSENGDYIIPFLPAGDYTVTFELQGFATIKQAVNVKMADVLPVNVKMALSAVTETLNISAAASETATTATVATTLKASTADLLPMGRTLDSATLFSPNANNNGPSGTIMISGALSYDNLYLVNGVNVNETQTQQPRPLYIEDAIQETKVSAGDISAEYGRFQGGVVNMITKSGGNTFSGSLRVTFTNDAWRSLTPYPGDSKLDKVVPAYEMTFGGAILRDKLWFFTAGRYEKNTTNVTAPYTGYNYTKTDKDERAEGKLTWNINPNNTVKVSYLKRKEPITNDSFGKIMDAASLYNDRTDESLLAANYQSVVTNDLFVEGQYSARKDNLLGRGSSYMDEIHGTPIWDKSRGKARFSAPTYCAVCPNYANEMNNWDAYVKANYFLSTKTMGSHSIVAGFDVFRDMRKNNQNSSASSYRVQATGSIIDGYNIYPIFKPKTTWVEWLPVFQDTVGSDLRTDSAFFNDTWRANDLVTLNLGVRYDKNNIRDQGGSPVANAGLFSPRLGATFDLKHDGSWLANVGYAQYVGAFITQVADAASAAGRQASYSFLYQGPAVNTGSTGPYLNSYDALKVLFDWWNSTGGPSGHQPRQNPTIPGVNTAVDHSIEPAKTKEYSLGIAHTLGSRGVVRVDYLYRQYDNTYGDFLDMSTGVVTDPRTGRQFNLDVVKNTSTVTRNFQGLSVQASYQVTKSLQAGANYMLSSLRGSTELESPTSITNFASANYYPEYRQKAWNYPYGYLNADQRHRLRVWGTYELPLPKELGTFDLGFQERYDSGRPYDLSMSIDSRPYVTNPGYLAPPSSVTYFISGRGAHRFAGSTSTDLSLSWSHHLPGWTNGEFFVRFVVNNLFNEHALTSFDTTVLSKSDDSSLQAFNPFTTRPVEGVNWKKGPNFGQATSPFSYQSPRDYYFSVGIRF